MMSPLRKLPWFIRRFGFRELAKKPIRALFSKEMARLFREQCGSFMFDGVRRDYFFHHYNATWCNERMVEIAIALDVLDEFTGKRVLEIGNVMAHYTATTHRVVDKYEGPEKTDVLDLKKCRSYDLVFAISTLEHVGFDERGGRSRFFEALDSATECVKDGGTLFVTIPMGYNPDADEFALGSPCGYLQRTGYATWKQVDRLQGKSEYGRPFPYANRVAICRTKIHRRTKGQE